MSARRITFLLIFCSLGVPHLRAQDPSKTVLRQPPGALTGSLENGTYRNPHFGFQIKLPFGWVDRTEQMRDSDTSKSLLLLAAFERPPEVKEASINSAVVITAETASNYPELKGAADYFGPLSEAATSKGLQVVNEPYYFKVGLRDVVRGDFSKKIGGATMQQASLVILERGYFVSLTFVAASDDDIKQLMEGLTFSVSAPKRRP
jgi:hypothetical protein